MLGIVVLTALALWVDLPQHPEINIGSFKRDLDFKLGLDLKGGTQLIYRADISGINPNEVPDSLAGVRDVIERRVNAFGIAEPVIQTGKAGDEQRVIVELAGVYDPQRAIKQIGETPQLDFRREVSLEEAKKQFNIDDQASIQGPMFERTELSGKNLKRATVSFEPTTGAPEVELEFDSAGSDLFAKLTRENLNKRIAIYLDEVPISAPTVQSEITNGRAVISGGFTVQEAKQLAQRLNAGALPVPIELIGQQTIGASLGADSVNKSIVAGVLGSIAVLLWMMLFYRIPGLLAGVALAIYVVLFLALIKLLPVTLTLAGIAGLIMSIGMAVDANVLVFERFRENIRSGKRIGYALDDGFREAWGSIKASNLSSLLTAVILYSLGTSVIRGFALTYAMGIILSMFTAITVSRVLLRLYLLLPSLHKPFLLSVKPDPEPTL